MSSWLTQYALAVLAFCVLDGIWLTVVAADLYDDRLGTLLAEDPNALAAVAFYALFVAGLVHFVIRPAVAEDSWRSAVLNGSFFGLVTYATWDLTNLAVLEGFPASLVPVDLAWGALLAASTSVATYAAFRRLRPRAA